MLFVLNVTNVKSATGVPSHSARNVESLVIAVSVEGAETVT